MEGTKITPTSEVVGEWEGFSPHGVSIRRFHCITFTRVPKGGKTSLSWDPLCTLLVLLSPTYTSRSDQWTKTRGLKERILQIRVKELFKSPPYKPHFVTLVTRNPTTDSEKTPFSFVPSTTSPPLPSWSQEQKRTKKGPRRTSILSKSSVIVKPHSINTDEKEYDIRLVIPSTYVVLTGQPSDHSLWSRPPVCSKTSPVSPPKGQTLTSESTPKEVLRKSLPHTESTSMVFLPCRKCLRIFTLSPHSGTT